MAYKITGTNFSELLKSIFESMSLPPSQGSCRSICSVIGKGDCCML